MPQTTVLTMPQTTVPQGLSLNMGPKPLSTPNIPQLAGLIVAPQANNVIQMAQVATTPNIHNLAPKQPPVDVNEVLAKMPGITISAINSSTTPIPADIHDILQREADETEEDFQARERLTITLSTIPDYKLNNTTAVIAGYIMMKKSKLGITYDPDVESAIGYLVALLERQ